MDAETMNLTTSNVNSPIDGSADIVDPDATSLSHAQRLVFGSGNGLSREAHRWRPRAWHAAMAACSLARPSEWTLRAGGDWRVPLRTRPLVPTEVRVSARREGAAQ
jgi:hypothetical protein